MKPLRISIHEPLRIDSSVLSNKSNNTVELLPESCKITHRKKLSCRPLSDLDLNFQSEIISDTVRNNKK